METSFRVTFIVLVEAGLSGQQSYHSYVDLSSAPLTSEYVLALKKKKKRHPYVVTHDLALFSGEAVSFLTAVWVRLVDEVDLLITYKYRACLESSFHWHKAAFTISSIIVEKEKEVFL